MHRMDHAVEAAYLFGFGGGVLSIVTALLLMLFMMYITRLFGPVFKGFVYVILVLHFICAIMMMVSAILIRTEGHELGGSVTMLSAGILGVILFAGILIGPILAIIGGMLGLKEHQKIILHKHEHVEV